MGILAASLFGGWGLNNLVTNWFQQLTAVEVMTNKKSMVHIRDLPALVGSSWFQERFWKRKGSFRAFRMRKNINETYHMRANRKQNKLFRKRDFSKGKTMFLSTLSKTKRSMSLSLAQSLLLIKAYPRKFISSPQKAFEPRLRATCTDASSKFKKHGT